MRIPKRIKLSVMAVAMLMITANADDIPTTASKAGKFKILLAAVTEAELTGILKSKGPFTVLAPTDEAFGKLPKGTLESLLRDENREKLVSILKYHVISGAFEVRKVASLETVKTVEGSDLSISLKDGRLKVGNAAVIATDIKASNGIIHVIDNVLLPPSPMTTAEKMKSLVEFAISKGVASYNSGNYKACAEVYEMCARSLVLIGKETLSQRMYGDLESALEKVSSNHSDSSNAWTLRRVLDKIYTSLEVGEFEDVKLENSKALQTSSKSKGFRPVIEAKLPKGFPAPGPLNEIVVKKYPVYRAARVSGGMQNISFMRLFGHIKKNNISMTAPVEMGLDKNTAARQSMAFLYRNPDMGQTGTDKSGIEVVDLPAQEYVSIGLTGRESQSAVKRAVKKLEKWLADNSSVIADGKPRLLGYNSPMVPADKRFWEVQIPVKRAN